MSNEKKKTAYVVWANTDLTEGRGREYIVGIYEFEATAKRFAQGRGVQGCAGRITSCFVSADAKHGWIGPVTLIPPSEEDMITQKRLTQRNNAKKRALELGLTVEEIVALCSSD